MAGSKEDTETGAFFQEHAGAGSATPLLVVSAGSATPLLVVSNGAASTAPSRSNRRGGPLLLADSSGLLFWLLRAPGELERGGSIFALLCSHNTKILDRRIFRTMGDREFVAASESAAQAPSERRCLEAGQSCRLYAIG
jgi:hypothetical protein